jgi:RND family efflux transporter MFP subunit
VVKINPVRVSLTVPQQNSGQIKSGQKVIFHVDSFPDKNFEAKVRYISPAVASDTRSLLVEAVADNADGVLHPGEFVTAELELTEQQAELFVPAGAVRRTGEVARVLVVRDGVAREQVVALGVEAQGKVHIRSGLTGQELLLARPERYRDGDKVR